MLGFIGAVGVTSLGKWMAAVKGRAVRGGWGSRWAAGPGDRRGCAGGERRGQRESHAEWIREHISHRLPPEPRTFQKATGQPETMLPVPFLLSHAPINCVARQGHASAEFPIGSSTAASRSSRNVRRTNRPSRCVSHGAYLVLCYAINPHLTFTLPFTSPQRSRSSCMYEYIVIVILLLLPAPRAGGGAASSTGR